MIGDYDFVYSEIDSQKKRTTQGSANSRARASLQVGCCENSFVTSQGANPSHHLHCWQSTWIHPRSQTQ